MKIFWEIIKNRLFSEVIMRVCSDEEWIFTWEIRTLFLLLNISPLCWTSLEHLLNRIRYSVSLLPSAYNRHDRIRVVNNSEVRSKRSVCCDPVIELVQNRCTVPVQKRRFRGPTIISFRPHYFRRIPTKEVGGRWHRPCPCAFCVFTFGTLRTANGGRERVQRAADTVKHAARTDGTLLRVRSGAKRRRPARVFRNRAPYDVCSCTRTHRGRKRRARNNR